mgnify:CR=1 FL=1
MATSQQTLDKEYDRATKKLQDALDTLSVLVDRYEKNGVRITTSQLTTLNYSAEDLGRIIKTIKDQLGKGKD